jgi:ketosteroid isomerase-like protein
MAEHPNAELTRRGYEAFQQGDLGTLTELIAEDAVWHVGGHNSITGDYKGREAIFGLFAKFAEANVRLEVHDILANDTHAVVLSHVSAERGGKTIDAHTSDTMHVRDGRVTEFWSFPEDQAAFDAFWSD